MRRVIDNEHVRTLRDRESYLAGRAALKRSLGWEYQYDERERAALEWVLRQLASEDEDGIRRRGATTF